MTGCTVCLLSCQSAIHSTVRGHPSLARCSPDHRTVSCTSLCLLQEPGCAAAQSSKHTCATWCRTVQTKLLQLSQLFRSLWALAPYMHGPGRVARQLLLLLLLGRLVAASSSSRYTCMPSVASSGTTANGSSGTTCRRALRRRACKTAMTTAVHA
jgi:hypothetical protein